MWVYNQLPALHWQVHTPSADMEDEVSVGGVEYLAVLWEVYV